MASINFLIPSRKEELLTEVSHFCVKNIVQQRHFLETLRVARDALKEEGAEFIIDHFDLFYSVIHHGSSFPMDLAFKAYQELHRAVCELDKALGFLLEDVSTITEEVQLKYQNVMKMLLYIYSEIILFIENTNLTNMRNENLMRKKKSTEQSAFNIDHNKILLILNDILQRRLEAFWDPPIIEQSFLGLSAEVCYGFLSNPSIKSEKIVQENIFNVIGTLIKVYNYGTIFTIRAVQMIKTEEHVVSCFNDGVTQLVTKFNCTGLIPTLVKECTEWQTSEKMYDSQGSRHCALFLTTMAIQMPGLMLKQVLYLNRYLNYDSYTLRNAVLNVITEVLLNVLSNHSLTEEQIEYRDDFVQILVDHIDDVSAHVRSKVLHNWTKLQKNNAIPKKVIVDLAANVVNHLQDKSSLVRKSAIQCLTEMISSNIYGPDLSMRDCKESLNTHNTLLGNVINDIIHPIVVVLETEWKQMEKDLEDAIRQNLEDLPDSDDEEDEVPEELCSKIRNYLKEKKYLEAFRLSNSPLIFVADTVRNVDTEQKVLTYMKLIKSVYIDSHCILEELKQGGFSNIVASTPEGILTLEMYQEEIAKREDAVAFLEVIDEALPVMVELLETTAISDMQEAVEFFKTASQFKIDNVDKGVMAMLNMMKRNEQDRKDIVVEAFKNLYLITHTTDMKEHCSTVISKLIGLVKETPSKSFDDLELIIKEWVKKGILDNSMIDMLWQYFTLKIPVSEENSHASVELLRMASLGRKTITSKNVVLVANIGFGSRGASNMAFLGSVCELLAVAGRERIDIDSKQNPFKVNVKDPMFAALFRILLENFFNPIEFYYKALSGAMNFLFKVCGKPDKFCDDLINAILVKLKQSQTAPKQLQIQRFVYMRLFQLLGLIAIKQLDYLDDTVYRELKRRKQIKENKTEKPKSRKTVNASATSAVHNTTLEESELEGAQTEDSEAEFILTVLEKETVSGTGGLGKLAHLIKNVCQRPDVHQDVMLQGSAVIALMRYMLVSSEFCQENVRLLFTILEKTTYEEVKESILIHLSDLLTRFPNVIEPWTPQIYKRLKDPSINIRKATFFTLSGLILRDMIRANAYISQMVGCLVDEDPVLSSMCRTFFITLAQKENNLYTMLPDIFSHMVNSDEINNENVRDMMKFLFNQISKTKQMENLVDRFCAKFAITENVTHHRNIAYCLNLISYNDKGLKKLLDNFGTYKHLVHDSEIYASFKSIMQTCSKQQVGKTDLRPLVAEIEKNINSVFDLEEDPNKMKAPPPPKSAKSVRSVAKKRKKKRQIEDDDDENDENEFPGNSSSVTEPVRRTPRCKKTLQMPKD